MTINFITSPNTIIAATDGSSHKGIAGSGICYYNDGMIRYESFKVEGKGTNNRGELYAIYKALELLEFTSGDIFIIVSDSEYSIKTFTIWTKDESIEKIKSRKNSDIILDILELIDLYKEKGLKINMTHVNSHLAKKGVNINDLSSRKWLLATLNEKADRLANYKNFKVK